MYLAVDIGGTKTLLAVFDAHGKVTKKFKFETPKAYDDFLVELATAVANLGVTDFKSACVAIPGRVDRDNGIGIALGNLPWKNFAIGPDLEKIADCPVIVENDAKLAALSEATLIKEEFNKVLYVTVSTGIGIGVVTNGVLDPDFLNSEGGKILLEHHDRLREWESFASGKAIFKKYGMRAADIDSQTAWRAISRNLAVGLIDNIAIIQPDVIVIGGGVGSHFKKFRTPLRNELKKFETPLIPVPPIRQAERAEEAVIYGCYELIRQRQQGVK